MSHQVKSSAVAVLMAAVLAAPALAAQQRFARVGGGAAGDLSDHALVNRTAARSIGPAVMSGRIVDIAVAESPLTRGGRLGTVIYIAAATGGVWKSTSGGVDWEPILDDAGVGSMGDVTVAPSNSDIVWVGTGEPNNMRSSSYGDGVYKSVDAGASFEHMGLRTSQHVGRIVIHPENPDIVYVAAVGPLWGPGGERGVFKTTDGGETWEGVLTIDQHTGVTDLAMDPDQPRRAVCGGPSARTPRVQLRRWRTRQRHLQDRRRRRHLGRGSARVSPPPTWGASASTSALVTPRPPSTP